MPTSAPGSSRNGRLVREGRKAQPARGFTLIEIMVVLAIVAVGAGLISLAIRDPAETRLENEAARLVSLLEMARSEARAGGLAAVWLPTVDAASPGFRFVGLPAALALPTNWLDERVSAQVIGAPGLTLGPEAILPPQRVVLRLEDKRLEVGSDGLAAFAVLPAAADGAQP
jgi:general secretion pathway protein H